RKQLERGSVAGGAMTGTPTSGRANVWDYLRPLAGIVLLGIGLNLCVGYLHATGPGMFAADAVSTTAIVTAQRKALVGQGNTSYFPDTSVALYETFVFTDRAGTTQTAEDWVSAPFFRDHPVGSQVGISYYIDAPAKAVIGPPTRLYSKVAAWT